MYENYQNYHCISGFRVKFFFHSGKYKVKSHCVFICLEFLIISFFPTQDLIKCSKHFRKVLHLSDFEPSHVPSSVLNEKVTGRVKLESRTDIEMYEAVFLLSKPFIIKKPSKSIKTKHKRQQSREKT